MKILLQRYKNTAKLWHIDIKKIPLAHIFNCKGMQFAFFFRNFALLNDYSTTNESDRTDTTP